MITVTNLTKYFGDKKAVDNISFNVSKGEILGFLGPNGSGKSTTMRMVTGFIKPTSGTVFIDTLEMSQDTMAAMAKFGYLPENAAVYPDMTVFDYLEFCASIRGFKGNFKKKRVEETIEKCFLTEVKQKRIVWLSKGFKQRVCLAQSIIHDPEYLILDEPTNGLDPNQKEEVRRMLKNMGSKKVIILSTHILEEADAVCSRAIIIANGKIVADDTPENLKKYSRKHGAVTLEISECEPDKLLSLIRNIENVNSVEITKKKQEILKLIIFNEKDAVIFPDKITSVLHNSGYKINSIFIEKGKLDEVFRKFTLENKRGEEDTVVDVS